ncbi:MAG TPA: hypothetical protein VE091_06055 [Gemmatimonadales bacterium]|nr:hypothetical protein [Gemmatimonadales bacterium]
MARTRRRPGRRRQVVVVAAWVMIAALAVSALASLIASNLH